uniref:Uncharacterized protein n=1 Tax=Arundo donax TaxID=35708 RepID=A0A0A8Y183_ARUDO
MVAKMKNVPAFRPRYKEIHQPKLQSKCMDTYADATIHRDCLTKSFFQLLS